MAGEEQKQFVFVGLGNPGKKYEMTRHNIGYLVVKSYAQKQGWPLKDEARFEGQASKGALDNAKVHLLLPTTYMNESGRAVRKYLDFYKLSAQQVVVVTDDMDLPFGTMRFKASGSAGTHNGLKSIEKHLGTQRYARLRMGIGDKGVFQDAADYVLGRFSAEEAQTLDAFLESAVNVLQRLPSEETGRIMTDVNKKVKQDNKTDLLHGEGQEIHNESK